MTAPHARVITVSDGVAAGSREDRSGDALAGILSAADVCRVLAAILRQRFAGSDDAA